MIITDESNSSMILGQFLFGVNCGVFLTNLPKIMEEVIPVKWYNIFFGASLNMFIQIFFLVNKWLMMGVPTICSSDFVKVKKQMAGNFTLSYFKILPVPFMVASLFSIQFIFTHDPLGFLLRSRPKLESVEALKHIYLHETDAKYDELYKQMRYGATWEDHPEIE